jgi:hypothetical protein
MERQGGLGGDTQPRNPSGLGSKPLLFKHIFLVRNNLHKVLILLAEWAINLSGLIKFLIKSGQLTKNTSKNLTMWSLLQYLWSHF